MSPDISKILQSSTHQSLTLTSNLDENMKGIYRGKINSIMYAMQHTRPDINYAIIRLASYQSSPSQAHHKAFNDIFAYLKGTELAHLEFKRSKDIPALVAYADASYATNDNKTSQSGFLIYLFGNLVSWYSKKQDIVATSTVLAEYAAQCEATKQLMYFKGLLKEINIDPGTLILYTDNKATFDLAHNPVGFKKTRQYDVQQRYVTQMVEIKEINIRKIPGSHMLADSFTKPLPRDPFRRACLAIGMCMPYFPHNIQTNNTIISKFMCNACSENFVDRSDLYFHLAHCHKFVPFPPLK